MMGFLIVVALLLFVLGLAYCLSFDPSFQVVA